VLWAWCAVNHSYMMLMYVLQHAIWHVSLSFLVVDCCLQSDCPITSLASQSFMHICAAMRLWKHVQDGVGVLSGSMLLWSRIPWDVVCDCLVPSSPHCATPGPNTHFSYTVPEVVYTTCACPGLG
jgi:hypothetical protein